MEVLRGDEVIYIPENNSENGFFSKLGKGISTFFNNLYSQIGKFFQLIIDNPLKSLVVIGLAIGCYFNQLMFAILIYALQFIIPAYALLILFQGFNSIAAKELNEEIDSIFRGKGYV
jgi:hypothetical protein